MRIPNYLDESILTVISYCELYYTGNMSYKLRSLMYSLYWNMFAILTRASSWTNVKRCTTESL